MKLTPENKQHIDSLDLYLLLKGIRFSPLGDPWFQDETGDYWLKRYSELRLKDPGAAVAASKMLGWGK